MNQEQIARWGENIKGQRRGRKSRASVSIDSALHTYVVLLLGQKRMSQTMAARICGCSVQFLNMVITGRRRSQEIQTRFPRDILGLHSWDELEWRALAFQEKIAQLPLVQPVEGDGPDAV